MSPGQAVPPDAANRIRLATEDLEQRTLSNIDTLIGRLVYVASTRDYNSGVYHHDGLRLRFDFDAAQSALASCHHALFSQILACKLAELVDELERYFDSTESERAEIMRSWQQLRAYQMLIPADCDALSAEVFLSNMKLALATLHMRQLKARGD